jgi:hypothetical protein
MVMLICGNYKDHQDGNGCTAQCMQHKDEQKNEFINISLKTCHDDWGVA